ncbi:MAG: carbon-monoxide dehydrogenase small subunit [Ignavibacteria bacterium]|nr:MAG: carbon-monoxide dehydrogenase small subunit [Ignavibacteria bacterium]KAF0159133.1 MAG: carbon-monoxide dehydrogenase small subunit [Ignavibacteria bacterium]
MEIKFTLNGKEAVVVCEPSLRFIDLLREKLSLTGTKEGCGVGECGACTVIMNGVAVNSCLVLASQVVGSEVLTIEGIANGEELHLLQKNFLQAGAVQCGFCTPGMVLSSYALLQENSNPSEEEIKDAIAGNLCRCTGYKQILDAVKQTAKELNPSAKL